MAEDTEKDTQVSQDSQDTGKDDTSTDKTVTDDSDDSQEIATNLDDIPEEYRSILEEKMKSLNKDYTKKTQKLAADRKEMEDKIEKGEYWSDWYANNEKGIKEYNEYLQKKGKSDKSSDSSVDDYTSFDDAADDVFGDTNVKKAMAKQAKDKEELQDQMKAGMNMLVELIDVVRKDRYKDININPKKVMEYAFNKRTTNMDEAVEGLYRSDIMERDFQKRLSEEKEKWEEQSKANVLSINMPQGRTTRKVIARTRK